DLRRRRGGAQGEGGGIVIHGGVGGGSSGPGGCAVGVLEGNADLIASGAEDRHRVGSRRDVILCPGDGVCDRNDKVAVERARGGCRANDVFGRIVDRQRPLQTAQAGRSQRNGSALDGGRRCGDREAEVIRVTGIGNVGHGRGASGRAWQGCRRRERVVGLALVVWVNSSRSLQRFGVACVPP